MRIDSARALIENSILPILEAGYDVEPSVCISSSLNVDIELWYQNGSIKVDCKVTKNLLPDGFIDHEEITKWVFTLIDDIVVEHMFLCR